MIVLATLVSLLLTAPVAEDLTGKWSGAFIDTRSDGSTRDQGIFAIFQQKGNELTGTAGPREDRQYPIQKGVVDGTKVTFQVAERGDDSAITFTLTLVDGRLKGEASGNDNGTPRTAQIDIGRVK